jgi:NDP-sugar pyrophosphorylase family protein
MKAVILAGGKGTRLRPYTTSFPKPLVPVGDKPILEIVIRELALNGITDVIMAVGYLAELIIAYFNDGKRFNVSIEYSREEKPLGTVGPLMLVRDRLNDTFLVMNGDVLSDIDYKKLIGNHIRSGCIATIGLSKRKINVDFGVVELNEKYSITDYHEKPTINHFVSMGIYIFEPAIFDYIELNKQFDLPDLVKKLIKKGERVNGYIHDGYWLDIGRIEDYEKACNDIKKIME